MYNVVMFLRDRVFDIVQFIQDMSFIDRVLFGIGIGFLLCFIRILWSYGSYLIRSNIPTNLTPYIKPITEEEALEAFDALIEDGKLQIVDSSGENITRQILLNGKPLNQQKEGH